MTTRNSYIIEIEIAGVRSYVGPFAGLVAAENYVNDHQSTNRKRVHQLHEPLSTPFKINPNQTTIDDHINDVHDHVG